jgi:hypothetical protein
VRRSTPPASKCRPRKATIAGTRHLAQHRAACRRRTTCITGARVERRGASTRAACPSRARPGTANVPKEQASDRDDRSHRCRPVPAGRSPRFPVPGTHDRNRVIRCRLPLRDDHSIAASRRAAQAHLSPTLRLRGAAIHSSSTNGQAGARAMGAAHERDARDV